MFLLFLTIQYDQYEEHQKHCDIELFFFIVLQRFDIHGWIKQLAHDIEYGLLFQSGALSRGRFFLNNEPSESN